MLRLIFLSGTMLLIGFNSFGQIEGVVIDQKKIAILDAIIIVTDTTGKAIDTVKSDKRGAYAFKSLKPGKYNVEAKMAGFLPAIYKNIEITTAPEGTDEHDDTYYAIRLDIKLILAKVP
ncbi:MAG: carboxypeptidase-like regulatory domain-containing protein [Ginsengibacter sp.]